MAKIMEIDVDHFEARVCITDDESKTKFIRTYYLYKGKLTVPELIDLNYYQALRYGVTEIQIHSVSKGVGCQAYARLAALARGDGSAINVVRYDYSPLVEKK